jgi:cysteine desulfurase
MPAKDAVEKARGQVAGFLGCDPIEVVFTSGGSESNNHAIKGVFFANRDRGDHIITIAVEHPATINPCRFLEKLGAKVTVLPVDRYGMVDPEDIRRAITPRTILITVMHANNEVGNGSGYSQGIIHACILPLRVTDRGMADGLSGVSLRTV